MAQFLIAVYLSFADILALAGSIQDLSKASRRARTAMWCSLMVTLLKNFTTNESESASQETSTSTTPATSTTTPATATTSSENSTTISPATTNSTAATSTAAVTTTGK